MPWPKRTYQVGEVIAWQYNGFEGVGNQPPLPPSLHRLEIVAHKGGVAEYPYIAKAVDGKPLPYTYDRKGVGLCTPHAFGILGLWADVALEAAITIGV